MVQSIRIDGISSGLDTTSLITKMMELERAPLLLMQSRQQKMKWQQDALKDIKSSVFALQNKATDLTRTATFSAMKADSSDEKVATATALSASASASYLVNIVSLATADRYTSAALTFSAATKATIASTAELNTTGGIDANPNAAFNSGATNLESPVVAGSFYVNSARVDVTLTDTVNTILNKITASTAGVIATLSGDKITITQTTGGSTPTITLSGDTSGFLAAAKLNTAVVTPGVTADENRLLKDTPLDGALTNGYFSINGTFFSVDKNNDTLMDVISRINSSTTAGVTAFYDANSKMISINSKTAGTTGNITLGTAVTDTSNFLSAVNIASTHQIGVDAVVTVNGVAVTPVNNKVTVNGANISLKGAGQTTITVQSDTEKMVASVQAFVDQYNMTMTAINDKLTKAPVKDATSDADKKVGILYGNSILRNLSSSIRGMTSATVPGMPLSMSSLFQIGITTGKPGSSMDSAKQGTLVLDTKKLTDALTSNASAVAALLGNGTVAVSNEAVGTGDGATTLFNLDKKPVAYVPAPSITVAGIAYTLVAGTPSVNPLDHEYSMDYTNGKITFGAAPGAGQAISATYNYSVTSGSQAGLMTQLSSILGSFTRVGGTFDSSAGSSGSITKRINDLQKQMESMQRRLDLREANYYQQFNAMEKSLSAMKSQGQWLTNQLSSLFQQ